MQTVTNEIELVLNSGRLGVLHDDNLEEPLTPNRFLFERQLQEYRYNYSDSLEDGVRDAYKRVEYLETVGNGCR